MAEGSGADLFLLKSISESFGYVGAVVSIIESIFGGGRDPEIVRLEGLIK
jgi:hypothetical protein